MQRPVYFAPGILNHTLCRAELMQRSALMTHLRRYRPKAVSKASSSRFPAHISCLIKHVSLRSISDVSHTLMSCWDFLCSPASSHTPASGRNHQHYRDRWFRHSGIRTGTRATSGRRQYAHLRRHSGRYPRHIDVANVRLAALGYSLSVVGATTTDNEASSLLLFGSALPLRRSLGCRRRTNGNNRIDDTVI
jgi:hypothetical protein